MELVEIDEDGVRGLVEMSVLRGRTGILLFLVNRYGLDVLSKSVDAQRMFEHAEPALVDKVAEQFSGLGRIEDDGARSYLQLMREKEEDKLVQKYFDDTTTEPDEMFSRMLKFREEIDQLTRKHNHVVAMDLTNLEQYRSYLEDVKRLSALSIGKEV